VLAVLGLLVAMTISTVAFGTLFASEATVKTMIEGRIVTRAIVLFLVVPVIAILCAQERISGEAALAALSAIASYILGQVSS
jgi:sorbitol-specific phosphotransferase system component IIC